MSETHVSLIEGVPWVGNSSISSQLQVYGVVCELSAGASVQLHFYPLHSGSLILMLH